MVRSRRGRGGYGGYGRGRPVVITALSPTFTIKASMLARVAMAKKLLWEHYERTTELLSLEKVERAKQAAARDARMARRASLRARFRRAKERKQMRSLADEARRVVNLPRCVTQFCLPEHASVGFVTLHHRDNKRRAAYGAYLTCAASRCLEITSLSVLLNARGTFMLTVYCADGSADAREPDQQARFRRLTDQAVTCTDPAQPVRIDLAPDGRGVRVNFEARCTFGIHANRKAIVYGYEEPHIIFNNGNKSSEQPALFVEQTKSLIGRSGKPFDRLNQRPFVGAIHFKAWFGDQTELKGQIDDEAMRLQFRKLTTPRWVTCDSLQEASRSTGIPAAKITSCLSDAVPVTGGYQFRQTRPSMGPGTSVVIHNLKIQRDLNGLHAVIQELDRDVSCHEQRRWKVLVENDPEPWSLALTNLKEACSPSSG